MLSNGYGSNSPLTPSARISALNIVSDLLRKVGVSHPCFQVSGLPFLLRKGEHHHYHQHHHHHLCVNVSPQALESKLAACRNFAKDQRARKAYALDNSNALNANTANYSQSLHTSYFDKAWVKPKPNLPLLHLSSLLWDALGVLQWHTVVYCVWYGGWLRMRYGGVSETCVHLFPPAGQRWSHSLHWFWVIAAPPPVTWVCRGACMLLLVFNKSLFSPHIELIEITMNVGYMTSWSLTIEGWWW